MIVVIIAGGSGTRLWPLSTPDYPKHLLKINGDDLSLLQHTYERAKQLTDKVYVVSDASHIDHVRDQLSELSEDHFIVEPARRGTANCIVAALVYIGQRHDHDDAIASIAADHYIRDTAGFTHSFQLANGVADSEKRIVLVGVEPDYPATGFGYIQKGELLSKEKDVYNVHSFKEKPDFDVAKTYVESGNYLWNCSYFIGSVNTFKTNMQAHASDLFDNYQKLAAASSEDYENVYLGFENVAIDYALMEKVPDLLVLPASFDWMDLGSFSDLHKAIGGDEQGNHTHGNVELEGVTNSYVQNLDEKPLAVIGLDNVAVVNTPSGLLVARKDMAQEVGVVSKRIAAKS
ncbi:MAG TPA: mannose-1-phosphate guanylyltransferase [Candidatus Saccharimonadales bacterium]|nr:mannose-1-phosphate guanylyltransferase [Candidatus Saccharimonadales bacterium]